MATRQRYDEALVEVQHDILRMGSLVEAAISNTIKALSERDIKLAEQVLIDDDKVDDYKFTIEDECVKLIATQQPIAKDLRVIFAAMEIVTDLERMADYAVDIARITKKIANEEYIKPLIDIPRMGEITIGMVKDCLDSYVSLDVKLAAQVCERDNLIDGLFEQIYRELLTYMFEDHNAINQATEFLFVSRYLERIADHTTNICEWIIYNVTGEKKDLN